MKKYETTFITDLMQKSDDSQTAVSKVESFIKNHGGNILNKEDWGKKRLAYEINRKQYGTYHHFLFEGPETLPGLLEREYRLDESIIRYLTVAADPRNYPDSKGNEEAEVATRPAPAPSAVPEPAEEEKEKTVSATAVAEDTDTSEEESALDSDAESEAESDKEVS